MIPILTPDEVKAVDAAAPEPVEVLVGRAGAAVAREAVDVLGGAYGRRVVVVAGKGNNGADGRVAAALLARRGVRVDVVDAAGAPEVLPPCDLVIDAAYGTGFRGTWDAPAPGGAPVLAVDIPSGVDALTGEAGDSVLAALRTVTFQAVKPGHLLGRGADLAGEIVVVDIGLDASIARAHLVEDTDVAAWLPTRARDAHKWQSAVWVVAGSPGMTGAASLCAAGALRAGAGYVRVSVPGGEVSIPPVEAVGFALPSAGWDLETERFGSLVVGPGLGRGSDDEIRALAGAPPVPLVLDGDALTALGPNPVLGEQVVLTPHDGEFERLAGHRPSADRFEAVRALAGSTGAVVLLKGPTTVVADPDGEVLVAAAGGPALATAGTGDVLSGVIGALLAQGIPPLPAAAAGAHLHGLAASLGHERGLVAGDLPGLLPLAIAALV